MVQEQRSFRKQRVAFYWMSFLSGYVFPLSYYGVKLGITKDAATMVLPVILLVLLGVVKLAMDVPNWVSTWRPGIWKGIILMLPVLFVFIFLITFGVGLQYILARQIELNMMPYYETVLVLFGSHTVAGVLNAVHLKYKDLDLISKGYVLGVVNK
jgi:hypothetical protein